MVIDDIVLYDVVEEGEDEGEGEEEEEDDTFINNYFAFQFFVFGAHRRSYISCLCYIRLNVTKTSSCADNCSNINIKQLVLKVSSYAFEK